MPRPGRALRRADDDGAWKRVLRELLREFVAFALPELHDAIDWSRAPVALEQELRPHPQAGSRRQAALKQRVADLVTQVWLRSGETTWLLIHTEVQGGGEADFAERMYTYAALLHLHYRVRPVRQATRASAPPDLPLGLVGIALLTDADTDRQPEPYRWGWGDYGLHYRYRTLKLTDWQTQLAELARDERPFAWVIRAWLAVQAAGQSLDAQSEARRSVGRALLAARREGRLTADQVVATYIFLDAVNRLPDMLAELVDREIVLTEEEPMAEMLTSWERRGLRRGLRQGREEGREQGQIEGMSVMIVRQLRAKGLVIDDAIEARIGGLDRDTLLALADTLLTLQNRADLDAWLAQATGQGT